MALASPPPSFPLSITPYPQWNEEWQKKIPMPSPNKSRPLKHDINHLLEIIEEMQLIAHPERYHALQILSSPDNCQAIIWLLLTMPQFIQDWEIQPVIISIGKNKLPIRSSFTPNSLKLVIRNPPITMDNLKILKEAIIHQSLTYGCVIPPFTQPKSKKKPIDHTEKVFNIIINKIKELKITELTEEFIPIILTECNNDILFAQRSLNRIFPTFIRIAVTHPPILYIKSTGIGKILCTDIETALTNKIRQLRGELELETIKQIIKSPPPKKIKRLESNQLIASQDNLLNKKIKRNLQFFVSGIEEAELLGRLLDSDLLIINGLCTVNPIIAELSQIQAITSDWELESLHSTINRTGKISGFSHGKNAIQLKLRSPGNILEKLNDLKTALKPLLEKYNCTQSLDHHLSKGHMQTPKTAINVLEHMINTFNSHIAQNSYPFLKNNMPFIVPFPKFTVPFPKLSGNAILIAQRVLQHMLPTTIHVEKKLSTISITAAEGKQEMISFQDLINVCEKKKLVYQDLLNKNWKKNWKDYSVYPSPLTQFAPPPATPILDNESIMKKDKDLDLDLKERETLEEITDISSVFSPL